MIAIELQKHLLVDVELVEIVGESIYHSIAPVKAIAPFIVISVINDKDLISLQGDNYSNSILFQIDCYEKSYLKVMKLKGAVKDAMYKFNKQPHNFNSRDGYEEDTKLHRQLIQFKINT